MPIQITDLAEARRVLAQGFDGIVSIADPWADTLVLGEDSGIDHLELRFVDLDEPLSAMPGEIDHHLVMPAIHMVKQALVFADRHAQANLLIHCHAGVSRSTAIALAVFADRLGPGGEEQALDALLGLVPDAVPNLAVVALADDLLQRSGQLLGSVMRWEDTTPRNAARRALNRAAYQQIFFRS